MTSIFWELSDEEILLGISFIKDTGEVPDHPMEVFNHDSSLQLLAGMWLNSDRDKTLMKLKFADEIRVLEEVDFAMSNLWYNPNGLNKDPRIAILSEIRKLFSVDSKNS
jgi:hypothetical protein